jgi:hypothetical protein
VVEPSFTYGSDGFADSDLRDVGSTFRLNVFGEKAKLDVLDLVESVVVLIERINEVLDFGHSELSVRAKKKALSVSGKAVSCQSRRKLTEHEGDQIEERFRYGTSDRFERKRKELGRC